MASNLVAICLDFRRVSAFLTEFAEKNIEYLLTGYSWLSGWRVLRFGLQVWSLAPNSSKVWVAVRWIKKLPSVPQCTRKGRFEVTLTQQVERVRSEICWIRIGKTRFLLHIVHNSSIAECCRNQRIESFPRNSTLKSNDSSPTRTCRMFHCLAVPFHSF